MGASEFAMTAALWFCDHNPRTRTIYFMPSDELVRDFSHDRVKPIIAASPRLAQIVGGVYSDAGVENVGLKHVGQSSLYMRGMFAKSKTKSIPADFILFDELDEAKRSNKQQAIERLSHSTYRWIMELSTPTLPGYGIDEEWNETDKRYWHLACRCPEGVVLEDNFPECVGERDGRFFLMCPHCGKEDLNPCVPAIVGEYAGWIPKHPERREKRGYHLSQLFSTYIPLAKIMALWNSGRDREEFYNSKLGMPFAGDRMPLTDPVLRACAPEEYPAVAQREEQFDRIFIGADQGYTLHVVVTKEEKGKRKTLWIERIGGSDPFARLAELIDRYKPTCTVIDAMPNSVPAKQLCEAKRNCFRCFYNDASKEPFKFDVDNRVVSANRTHMLDQMVQDWQHGVYRAPLGHPELPVAFRHLGSLAKVMETHEVTGVQRWVYRHIGEDHYAHAYNYERIAASYPYGRCDFAMI